MALYGSQLLSSVNDSIVFVHNNSNEIGRMVRVHRGDRISIVLFKTITEEVLLQFALPIITSTDSPLAVKSGMVELMETEEVWKIPRSTITDLTFIIPLHEVESGLFHLAGACNTYFIRYKCTGDEIIHDYQYSMLQATVGEPLSHRIFKGFNPLSSSVKRLMYHHPEEHATRKTTRLPLSCDAFHYLWSKLCNNNNIILHRFEGTQRSTIYFDDLSMKSCSRINQVLTIRILSSGGLDLVRKLLGVGIGIGLGKPRPTKSHPMAALLHPLNYHV
jgi:hypothetical protein